MYDIVIVGSGCGRLWIGDSNPFGGYYVRGKKGLWCEQKNLYFTPW